MKKFVEKYTFIWPLLGSLILWGLIGAVSGRFTANQLFSCARLASFALLLALGQMLVTTTIWPRARWWWSPAAREPSTYLRFTS